MKSQKERKNYMLDIIQNKNILKMNLLEDLVKKCSVMKKIARLSPLHLRILQIKCLLGRFLVLVK